MGADRGQIKTFLERFGDSLSRGDLKAASGAWAIPALVLSDEGVVAVSKASEVEEFFAKATEWYRSQGLVATKPEVERIESVAERLTAVDVRWPTFDAAGQEKTSERSHYILEQGKDGQLRIRLALTRTTEPGKH